MDKWKLQWLDALERTSCTNCGDTIEIGSAFLIIARGAPSVFNPKEFGEGPEVAHLCGSCCTRMGVFKAQGELLLPGN
ncbi:MAG: hypothetical protein AAB152_02515 [Candidatus Coatesbacteria bacterium]